MAGQDDGIRYGDDRAVVDPPNWDNLKTDKLFQAATGSNNPGLGQDWASAWRDSGNRLAGIAMDLTSMLGALGNAWQGPAAGSARDALNGLASRLHWSGKTAAGIGNATAEASVAAQEVKTLPPPKPFDLGEALRAGLTGGQAGWNNDLQKQSLEAEKVRQEQVSYLKSYTAAMAAIDSHTPTFEPPPSPVDPGGGDSHHRSTGGGVNYVAPKGKVDQGTSTGTPSGPYTGAMPGAGGPNAPGDRDDDLNLDNVGPIPGFPGANTGTSGYTGSPAISPNLPGAGGLGQPAAPAAGAGGFGGAFGSFAGGPGGGSGPNQPNQTGAGAPGERGAGRGPGASPLGEEALRGRGTAQGAGRGGVGGAGGPMGAGARDEDDEEHDRPSYLVEADPEGTFGTDEVTAPPVIGQD